ncbi:MAG: ACT domain-containing protein [Wenzhouxiangellaceae bacterium]|nr:ACT domain-containing protein [Wenzhouxiangellaceae bacterium]
MTTRFEITLDTAEGAMIRTLGLIQRRGFTVSRMDMKSTPQNVQLRLEVADCERCPEVLQRQIERLHDVQHVRQLTALAAAQPHRRIGRALVSLFAPRPRVAVGSRA